MNEKWIIVTGASRGIGLETSTTLLKNKYKVVLTSRRILDVEEAFSVFSNDSYKLIPCDLNDTEQIKQFSEKVNTEVGKISGLVHCAGSTKIKPLSLIKRKDIEDLFSLNVFSTFELIKQFSKKKNFVPGMCSFVLLSSIAAIESVPGRAIYASTKGSLNGMLKTTAAELLQKGIRLNIVSPGIVQSTMTENYLNKLPIENKKQLLESYPLGFGSPEDVSFLVEFLLSEKAKWITGQNFTIDGGHSLINSY